jgi:protein-S-isoprenylcysteine O-methyltransferase Ste14
VNHKTWVLWVKSFVFTAIVPGTVSTALPLWIIEGVGEGNLGSSVLGLLCFVSGLGIYSGCVWDFICFGKGTPAPIHAPQHLVIRGLYHYSRNPMYVAVLLVILGWALVYMSGVLLLYCGAVWICFQMLVIFYEEPILQRLFGEGYRDYKKSVHRWLC